ncbi:MAG: diacylglycerol kinase family protein, partial [Candidatus Poseidoniaceae archaeon]
MARVQVIVNPASRDGRCGKAWPEVRRRMEEDGWQVEAFITAGPGDAAHHAHHRDASRVSCGRALHSGGVVVLLPQW